MSHGCGAAPVLPKKKKVGDMFAGAGGASYGLKMAMKKLGVPFQLTAINHWDAAVKMHAANFPDADHYCSKVEDLDPRVLFPGKMIGNAWPCHLGAALCEAILKSQS